MLVTCCCLLLYHSSTSGCSQFLLRTVCYNTYDGREEKSYEVLLKISFLIPWFNKYEKYEEKSEALTHKWGE